MGVTLAKKSNVGVCGIGPRRPVVSTSTAHGTAFVVAVADATDGRGFFLAPDAWPGRYIVGGYADAVVLRYGASRYERALSASAFVAGNPGESYGFWHDENGRTWLDVIVAIDCAFSAARCAAQNGEQFVYDTATGRTL